METLKDIFDYVDEHFTEMYEDLKTICSYPSTAQQDEAREQTRQFLLKKLKTLGIDGKRCSVENGNDIIYGEMHGTDSRRVLFYNHYDVVDGGNSGDWVTGAPYCLEVRGDKMYARGISDNKGSLLTRVHAIQAVLATRRQLPVSVKFLWEGDEEIGSPSLSQFALENSDAFRCMTDADVCLWENGRVDKNGHPWARYGIRGSCCFNLTLQTAATEAHTRLSAVIPNAAERLCLALASLVDLDGRVAIEGFYDDVKWPDTEDIRVLRDLPYNPDEELHNLEIYSYLPGIQKSNIKEKIYTEPCMCICGLDAGGLFKKAKGVIPNIARAVLSFELVADMKPDQVEQQLRNHFRKYGFQDIEIEAWGKNVPVKTPVNLSFTKQLRIASQIVFKKSLVIEPLQLGPGPAYLFRNAWPDLPIVGIGPGNHASNHHSPNENLNVADYIKAVKHCIALLYTYENEREKRK